MSVGTAQTTAVRSNPHGALLVSQQIDDVGTHQSVLQTFRLLQLLNDNPFVANLHHQDAVRRTSPHLAVLGQCNGTHLHVAIVRIVRHDVLAVQGNVLPALVLAYHVDTTAICCHPYVALLVLNGLIGGVTAQRVGVVIVVADVDNLVASGCWRNLEQTLVLVAYPVVALLVHRDAVWATDGRSFRVLGDDGLHLHVLVVHEDTAFLVGQQCDATLRIV